MSQLPPPNPPRQCLRCPKPAFRPTGGAIWAKLCEACNKDRMARRERSRNQPKCRCGSCAPMDHHLCRACQERDEKSQATAGVNRKLLSCISRLRELSTELDGDPVWAEAGAEIVEIVNELEYVQVSI